MTSIASETLGLRRIGFSPILSLLIPACSLRIAPALLTGIPSMLIRTLSYHCTSVQSKASVLTLAPLNFRRRITRPVSCYAFFKWWLLLSQHPGCQSNSTSFSTRYDLGTLAVSLGCSPLDDWFYHPPPDSQDTAISIWSLTGFGTAASSPSPIRALPLIAITWGYT